MKFLVSAPSIALFGSIAVGFLSGCSGGTTYGTGVSQEAQLASDIGGLVSLSGSQKKSNIDYASRPKLVKSSSTGELPAPAERVTSDAAYFPTNPEEKRAARLAAIKRGETVPETDEYGSKPAIARANRSSRDVNHEESAAEMLRKSKEGNAERLARATELREQRKGTTRKYLTQPPVEYQIPAETADAGKTGEYIKSEAEKKRRGIFSSWKTRD